MKTALVTGCDGMDGSHMRDLLIKKGYTVYGTSRKYADKYTFYGDLTDDEFIKKILIISKPDEVYHFAANSKSGGCWDEAAYTFKINLYATINLVEELFKINKNAKFMFASSIEIYKGCSENVYSPDVEHQPLSPYGMAKSTATKFIKNYANKYGLFAYSVILGNHTSEYQKDGFVIPKIIKGAIDIKDKKKDELILFNKDSFINIGYSPNFIEIIYKSMQNKKPRDFILNANNKISIENICNLIFTQFGLDYNKYLKIENSNNFFNNNSINIYDKEYQSFIQPLLLNDIKQILNNIINNLKK